MSQSSQTFTSSKHFDEFTYKLSQSMKSMKVSTLRESIAKAEGFSHVDAFRKNLDKQMSRPIIQTALIDPKLNKLPDIYPDIYHENLIIVFKGLPVLRDWWPEEAASYILTGDPDLLTPLTSDNESDFDLSSSFDYSDLMVKGYIALTDDSRINEVRCLKAIRNFYLGQSSEWGGRVFANRAFYWIHSEEWMENSTVIKILSDHLSGGSTSLESVERLKSLNDCAQSLLEQSWPFVSILGLSFGNIPFGDKKCLSNYEAASRFSSILFTVFDYLKYVGLKHSEVTPENIKKILKEHWYYQVPYMILPAVFSGIPIRTTDETFYIGNEQSEAISSEIMEAITSHPEIWSMGNDPIEKALYDYYTRDSNPDGSDLMRSINASGAVQHIAKFCSLTTRQSEDIISTIFNYIVTALIHVEFLQTRHPVMHTFKRYPFEIYGTVDGGDPGQISPMIAHYSREMKNVLDLSVATGRALIPEDGSSF